jgi:hypothetical protein
MSEPDLKNYLVARLTAMFPDGPAALLAQADEVIEGTAREDAR